MHLILGFVVAMSITMVLIPPLMRVADRFNFIDAPGDRKVHAHAIPRVGGIAMAIGILVSLLAWEEFSQTLLAFCAAVVVLLAFGIWDDRATISPVKKLLGQAIAVSIVMIWGDVSISSLTLNERYLLADWLSAALTFFFLVGATNAINLSDGLDGLAGGTSLLCLCALALLSLTVGNPTIGSIAVIAIGAILGFLRFNTYPARVFMGDSGSQILGFCVSVLSVLLTQDRHVPLSSALPLLLLGMPVIDTTKVMVQRVLAGHSPFRADRNHIHHRLLALGLDHRRAVMMIYLLQAALFVLAWYLRYDSDLRILAALLAFAALVIGSLSLAGLKGYRLAFNTPIAAGWRLTPHLEWLRQPDRLSHMATSLIGVAMISYEAIVLFLGHLSITPDVRLLAACVGIVLLLSTLLERRRHRSIGLINKGALYVTAVIAVYLGEHSMSSSSLMRLPALIIFAAIAIALIIRLRVSGDRRFNVNPLDMLVVLLALVIPNLPGSIATPQQFGVIVIKLVLMLYGIEALISVVQLRWRFLNIAASCFLAGIVFAVTPA